MPTLLPWIAPMFAPPRRRIRTPTVASWSACSPCTLSARNMIGWIIRPLPRDPRLQ
jgi:hypothetical protein